MIDGKEFPWRVQYPLRGAFTPTFPGKVDFPFRGKREGQGSFPVKVVKAGKVVVVGEGPSPVVVVLCLVGLRKKGERRILDCSRGRESRGGSRDG